MVLILLVVIIFLPGTGFLHPPGVAQPLVVAHSPGETYLPGSDSRNWSFSCIPSGDQNSITAALSGVGSRAILCPNSVFELSETIYFSANDQSIFTEGFPEDDTRALLRVVGDSMATAIGGANFDHVAIQNVIIDGNRPQKGVARGALIDLGRGIEDRAVEGQLVEWVRAYEPRGWTILYFGGICNGGIARNNEFGPAGRAEFVIADGISLECPNSLIENNTIIDATDGGIVIFQSPGSLVANNTIRAENRVLFYGISMEDYHPNEGNFSNTRVTGNTIDASGAMIRRGVGMGPYVGCVSEDENAPRSRGAVVTDNTLLGDYMVYGFVVSGVEDWTITGNIDLSTHLITESEWDCSGRPVDPPSGFQYNAVTSSGTFQPEFTAAVLGASTDVFPVFAVASEECLIDLLGNEVFGDIKAGNRGELWEALESAVNGERIGQCIGVYQPPDVSDLTGNIGIELLPCSPACTSVRIFNLSDDTASLERAEFLLDDFPVTCQGLPTSLGPWEETLCTIDDFVTVGFHVFRWFGVPRHGDTWVFNYPFESTAVTPDERPSLDTENLYISQTYPNPFSTSTVVTYTVPARRVRVHVSIYDLQGRLVRTLVDRNEQPGRHTVRWDGKDGGGRRLSSGVYLFRIDAGIITRSRKMIFLK